MVSTFENTIVIQNIVATINLQRKIDLEYIATHLQANVNIKYIPTEFPAVRIKLPKVTLLLFKSGKCLLVGGKRFEHIFSGRDFLLEKLVELKVSIENLPTIQIHNIVSSGDFMTELNLNLAALLLDTSIYEPEVFPGLIYRMQDPKLVILLFQSGKFVSTGCSREEIIYEGVLKTQQFLDEGGVFELKLFSN